MSGHKLQSEHVPDIDRGIRDDLGATRRDVQDKALALGHAVVDRDPGRLFAHFPSRFARYLCPRLVNSHDEHPSLDFNCDRFTQFPLQWLDTSKGIAEPVVGRICATFGDAPQDEVSNPHGEERIFARLEP
jgi:hypothetical protein